MSTQRTIDTIYENILKKWAVTGKIRYTQPTTREHAQKIAWAAAKRIFLASMSKK